MQQVGGWQNQVPAALLLFDDEYCSRQAFPVRATCPEYSCTNASSSCSFSRRLPTLLFAFQVVVSFRKRLTLPVRWSHSCRSSTRSLVEITNTGTPSRFLQLPADGRYSPTNTFSKSRLYQYHYTLSIHTVHWVVYARWHSSTIVLAPNSNVTSCNPASIIQNLYFLPAALSAFITEAVSFYNSRAASGLATVGLYLVSKNPR